MRDVREVADRAAKDEAHAGIGSRWLCEVDAVMHCEQSQRERGRLQALVHAPFSGVTSTSQTVNGFVSSNTIQLNTGTSPPPVALLASARYGKDCRGGEVSVVGTVARGRTHS